MTAYTFFDVETPNRRNDRICSIGIERSDAFGSVEYSGHFYVDPEQGFDSLNMSKHGITPSRVKGHPTFAKLWQHDLAEVFEGSILVAHNASFDMSVLGKTLDSYGIAKPDLNYICTYRLAKRHLDLPDYELPTLCAHYGVGLERHHDALFDALACEGVYWAITQEFGLSGYQGMPYAWVPYTLSKYKASSCDQAMTDLYGIALGIAADGVIYPEERIGLDGWIMRNEQNRQAAFFCDAYELMGEVLEDGIVTMVEREKILNLAAPFVQNSHNKAETVAMQELIGILRGITCDQKINAQEVLMLRIWLEELDAADGAGFRAVRDVVDRILADGVVDVDEEAELLTLFKRICDPAESGSEDTTGIDFQGKRFVLTGEFGHGSKDEVASFIAERGGEVAGSVSKKVAYVVRGGEGSEAYAYGNYGSKVKKAMELQDAGNPIQIIREDQLYE